jgi:spore coat protein U-like protein
MRRPLTSTYPRTERARGAGRRCSTGGAARLRYHAGVSPSLRALACAAALAAPAAARAAGSCSTLSASALVFGTYSPLATAPLDAAGTLTWRCPGVGVITVTLSRGESTTSTYRTMVGGSEQLAYDVYLDAARTTVLGDTTGGSPATLHGGGQTQSAGLYGRIFAQQDVSAGTYADTLVVTFTF